MQGSKLNVVIIGGGASGTLLARHILDECPNDVRVTLIEKAAKAGKGLTYDTDNSKHIVNVRASNMSAFQKDPGHFLRWLFSSGLAEQLPCPDQFCFVPRSIYGHYLEDLIAPLDSARNKNGKLQIIRGECVSIERKTRTLITLADGKTIESDIVVLATGNEFCGSALASPSLPSKTSFCDSADDDVLFLGTGLTMIDHVLSLAKAGHKGRMIAVSRRGLLSQPHRQTDRISIDRSDVPFGISVSKVSRWLRAQIRNDSDWRGVIDALRPHTKDLWRQWSLDEKRRFLRHIRPWWDVHRHRMAPEVEQQIKALVADGRLTIIAGRFLESEVLQSENDGAIRKVRIRRRDNQRNETLHVHKVIECRGIDNRLSNTSNPVLRDLAERGLVMADDLDIGIKVTADCAVVSRTGEVFEDVFALGSLTRGEFWEVVAVPDIRVQCERLANYIARKYRLSMQNFQRLAS